MDEITPGKMPDSGVSWTNPDLSLLSNQQAAPPAFPLELFDDRWSLFLQEVAQSACAPVDYSGAALLTLAGTMIGNSRRAVLGGMSQPPILWSVLVGDPSSGKSPALAPFEEIVRRAEEAIRSGAIPGFVGDRFRIADATPPATAPIAAANPHGLMLLRDELSGWWDRHAQQGGEQFWIEGYGGGSHSVDRKKHPSIFIPNLSISVLGGAQPDTLRAFAGAAQNRGFAARWLYIFPQPSIEWSIGDVANIEPVLFDLLKLLALRGRDDKPENCLLPDASRHDLQSWFAPKRQQAADVGGLWGEWLNKQAGMSLRLALIFEHLDWLAAGGSPHASPTSIRPKNLEAAFAFIDRYSEPMAGRTLDMAQAPKDERHARQLATILASGKVAVLNRRSVLRSPRLVGQPLGALRDATVFDAACRELEDACILRDISSRDSHLPGRTKKEYEVNPLLLSEKIGARSALPIPLAQSARVEPLPAEGPLTATQPKRATMVGRREARRASRRGSRMGRG